MPILKKDRIATKIENSINVITSSSNVSNVFASVENLIQIQGNSNTYIQTFTTSTLPDSPASNNQIIYLSDVGNFAIHSSNAWYTLDGTILQRLNRPSLSWGDNPFGQLGNGTTNNRSVPTLVIGGFTDWCQISTGYSHTSAVRTNGTLWSWGNNPVGDTDSGGRLGDNTVTDRCSPVSVVGGFTDWCQVSAGRSHTVALRQNGTLWAWGCGDNGRLGNNDGEDFRCPVAVAGGFTDWCQVSTMFRHNAALRTNGTLWTWGCNTDGQLGNSSTATAGSPVSVVGGFTDWCQVSAGAYHTSAVRTNGTIWAWGSGGGGRLGNNSTTNRCSPVSVVGGFTDWCQVSSGTGQTAAIRTNGTLWAWGLNCLGRLGDGTTVSKSSPVSVVGGFTDWCQVSTGNNHSAAVRRNGTLWAWGQGTCGRLGDGTTVAKSSPVSVSGGFTDWCQVSVGNGIHTSAIRTFLENI